MEVREFLRIVNKLRGFKARLDEENIIGQQQQIILKVYINDLTSRINTAMLKKVI